MSTYTEGNINNISHYNAAWVTLDGTGLGWCKNVKIKDEVKIKSQSSVNNNGVPLYGVVEDVEVWVEAEILETNYTSSILQKALHLTSLSGGTIMAKSGSIKGSQPAYYSDLIINIGDDSNPAAQIKLPKVYCYATSDWQFDGEKSDAKSLTVRFVAIEDTSITEVNQRLIQYIQTTDTTPFTVSSTTPANGGTGFGTSANIVLTFSETPGKSFRDDFAKYFSLVEADGSQITVANSNITWGGTGNVTATITGGTGGIGVLTSSTVHIAQVSPAFRASSGKYLAGDGGTGGTWFETDFETA